MKLLVSLFAASLLVGPSLRVDAAPPNRSDIPADSAWALHVDCDAFGGPRCGIKSCSANPKETADNPK